MRGPNMDWDHFLNGMIIKQKLLTLYIKNLQQKMDWSKFTKHNQIRHYWTQLCNRLKNMADQQEIIEELGKYNKSKRSNSISSEISKSWMVEGRLYRSH
jgi:hypothetical protein